MGTYNAFRNHGRRPSRYEAQLYFITDKFDNMPTRPGLLESNHAALTLTS